VAHNQPVEAASQSNFLVPNATFFVELAVFLIILWLLGKYILPRIQKVMAVRQEIIRKQLDDAEAARKQLAEAQAQYQNAIAEGRAEASSIRDNATREAQRIVEEMHAKARDESERIVARGEELLANQRAATVRELRAEIGTLAVDLASKIVGESLADEVRQRGTVDRFLEELDSDGADGNRQTDDAPVAG
jgi:F-type H+-transporting ATPase subunit b